MPKAGAQLARSGGLAKPAARLPRAEVVHTSCYLPKAVHEALREEAFKRRCKIHDIILEGIGLALGRRDEKRRPSAKASGGDGAARAAVGRREAEQFSGTTYWDDPKESGRIVQAVLRDNGTFDLNCVYSADRRYDIRLKRDGDRYAGSFQAREGADAWSGSASCELSRSGSELKLRGTWEEGNRRYTWIANLTAADGLAQ